MENISFTEFIVIHSEALQALARTRWWCFSYNDTEWLVKGHSASSDAPSYSLLLTNLCDVFFTTAGPTQIQSEAKVRSS
jgi:hypothetical protein